MTRSYLDHAATSPMPAEVLESYIQALKLTGNPASTHTDGQHASVLLEQARRDVARWLGAEPVEVTFTSGGTESINLALKGMFWERQVDRARPIVMLSRAEHHASIDAATWLQDHEGAHLVWLDVDETGALRPETLYRALHEVDPDEVALVTFLWANNEVGTVSPVQELCAIAAHYEIPVHVDAVAALGQVPVSLHDSGATMVSISAHKVGGPVGVGALALSRHATLQPLIHGGSQQRARSGTQNVAGCVAFAAALRHIGDLQVHADVLRNKRDRLINEVRRVVPHAVLRGADPQSTERLPANAHFTFPGCQGDSLLFLLDMRGVSVSVGSACQAGVQEISHVLLAMGLSEEEAIGSLRMTLAVQTTDDEIDAFIAALPEAVADAQAAGIVSTGRG